MSVKQPKLCDRLVEAIRDEGVASIDYAKIGEELAASGNCDLRNLGILLKKISQDEQSHKVALEGVAKLVCPAEALSRLRG